MIRRKRLILHGLKSVRESDDDVFATASAFSVSVARRKDFRWDVDDTKPWIGSAHNAAIRKAANDFDMVIFYCNYALIVISLLRLSPAACM